MRQRISKVIALVNISLLPLLPFIWIPYDKPLDAIVTLGALVGLASAIHFLRITGISKINLLAVIGVKGTSIAAPLTENDIQNNRRLLRKLMLASIFAFCTTIPLTIGLAMKLTPQLTYIGLFHFLLHGALTLIAIFLIFAIIPVLFWISDELLDLEPIKQDECAILDKLIDKHPSLVPYVAAINNQGRQLIMADSTVMRAFGIAQDMVDRDKKNKEACIRLTLIGSTN